MRGTLKKSLLVGLTLMLCVGILGCGNSQSTVRETDATVKEPEKEKAWGEATVDSIMKGAPVEE